MVDLYEIECFNSDNPDEELTVAERLTMAERANNIYRQQLKYTNDHIASLRSLIRDKETIIENLILRYVITKDNDNAKKEYVAVDEDDMDLEELRRKAEAMAQRTILENSELREMLAESREESFHKNNEMIAMQQETEESEAENVQNVNLMKLMRERMNRLENELENLKQISEEKSKIFVYHQKYEDALKKIRTKSAMELEEIELLRSKLQLFESMEREVTKLRRLQVHLTEFRMLFGCSFRSLIPYQLNDTALVKYGLLFDGYYRNLFDDAMIPKEVSKLISFYYPIFWTLETSNN